MRFVVLLLVGAVLLGGCGPNRDESGALEGAQDVSALDLQAGDCFNGGGGAEISDVQGVPCGEAHVFEVFAVATHDDGDFPGAEALQANAEEMCLADFEAYVGLSYEESKYVVQTINPSEETWEAGDRATLCVLSTDDKAEQTGSAKGSAV